MTTVIKLKCFDLLIRQVCKYFELKSKNPRFSLSPCILILLFLHLLLLSLFHFKSQVIFPRRLLDCHQLSSTAADLEPDTR